MKSTEMFHHSFKRHQENNMSKKYFRHFYYEMKNSKNKEINEQNRQQIWITHCLSKQLFHQKKKLPIRNRNFLNHQT